MALLDRRVTTLTLKKWDFRAELHKKASGKHWNIKASGIRSPTIKSKHSTSPSNSVMQLHKISRGQPSCLVEGSFICLTSLAFGCFTAHPQSVLNGVFL